MAAPNLSGLLLRLVDLPHETEWVEFKKDNDNPEDIGEYLSAISNSAALHGKEAGFIVWGMADATHELVGTSFTPRRTKIGNEDLESWLARLLTPRIDFRIHEIKLGGMQCVVFEVPPASHTPVRFRDNEWIRIGSYKKKLKDFPEKERHLWASFSPKASFENGVAAELVPGSDVLSLLDYPAYFDLTVQPLPEDRKGILTRLTAENSYSPRGEISMTSPIWARSYLPRTCTSSSISNARQSESSSIRESTGWRPCGSRLVARDMRRDFRG